MAIETARPKPLSFPALCGAPGTRLACRRRSDLKDRPESIDPAPKIGAFRRNCCSRATFVARRPARFRSLTSCLRHRNIEGVQGDRHQTVQSDEIGQLRGPVLAKLLTGRALAEVGRNAAADKRGR